MIISGITVNLSKLAMTEGSDEFDDNLDTSSMSFDQIVDHSKKCLEQYKSAFLPSKNAFISSHLQSSVCIPSQNIVQKQSRKRLLRHKESSVREIQKKEKELPSATLNGPNGMKVRQNTKNSPTCKFCLCSGHRIDHYPQRDQLKLDGSREFIVSDSFQNEDLRRRIENEMPIVVMSDKAKCVSVV